MEFKFNAFISTVMLVCVVFAVDCRLINGPNEDDAEDYYYKGVPVYTRSRACSLAGGICVQEGDCAIGELVGYGKQFCEDYEMGVGCCYKVISREGSCHSFGGECMKSCRQNALRQPLANDCPSDTHCCVVVQ